MNKLRQKILATNDIKRETLHIDAWDVDVEVRSLTGEQRARIVQATTDDNGKTDPTVFYAAATIESTYDPETGERVFQSADRDELLGKSVGAIQQVAVRILQLSGLIGDKEEKEEIRKNSGAASDDSISGSPKHSGVPSPNSSTASVATS